MAMTITDDVANAICHDLTTIKTTAANTALTLFFIGMSG